MMMHAKYESDATSLTTSSPSRSPKMAAYYVQSPSRDSPDSDKSSTMQATPVYNSPLESPSHLSFGRHSRTSSGSRFSGNLQSWSGRRIQRKRYLKHWNDKEWHHYNVFQVEGAYDDGLDDDKGHVRCFQIMIGFVTFVLFFTTLCLIIWGATKHYEPEVTLKALAVNNFFASIGTDNTGVPTVLITTNCTLKLRVYNSAPTFGIHVTSSPIDIKFSRITIATGQLEGLYISQKSWHTIVVVLQGKEVPVYGADLGLSLSRTGGPPVPLTLEFDIKTCGYVVGKLVKTRHMRHVFCKFEVDSAKARIKTVGLSKNDTCTYT